MTKTLFAFISRFPPTQWDHRKRSNCTFISKEYSFQFESVGPCSYSYEDPKFAVWIIWNCFTRQRIEDIMVREQEKKNAKSKYFPSSLIISIAYLHRMLNIFILIRNDGLNNTSAFCRNHFAIFFQLTQGNFQRCQPTDKFDRTGCVEIAIDILESLLKVLTRRGYVLFSSWHQRHSRFPFNAICIPIIQAPILRKFCHLSILFHHEFVEYANVRGKKDTVIYQVCSWWKTSCYSSTIGCLFFFADRVALIVIVAVHGNTAWAKNNLTSWMAEHQRNYRAPSWILLQVEFSNKNSKFKKFKNNPQIWANFELFHMVVEAFRFTTRFVCFTRGQIGLKSHFVHLVTLQNFRWIPIYGE